MGIKIDKSVFSKHNGDFLACVNILLAVGGFRGIILGDLENLWVVY